MKVQREREGFGLPGWRTRPKCLTRYHLPAPLPLPLTTYLYSLKICRYHLPFPTFTLAVTTYLSCTYLYLYHLPLTFTPLTFALPLPHTFNPSLHLHPLAWCLTPTLPALLQGQTHPSVFRIPSYLFSCSTKCLRRVYCL